MVSMKEFLLFITNPVIFLGLVALFFWALLHSPLLAWIGKIAAIVTWFLFTVGATIFCIAQIYVPKHEYWAALACLLAGGVISFPWFLVGYPALFKAKDELKDSIRLWQA